MHAPYWILASPKTVNLWREFRGGLSDGSRWSSTTPLVSLFCYTSSTLNPWRNVEELVASHSRLQYKVLHEHVVVSPDHLDLILPDRPVRGTVTKQRLKILRCSTTQFQKSFVPRTITQWNTLPDSITSVNVIVSMVHTDKFTHSRLLSV